MKRLLVCLNVACLVLPWLVVACLLADRRQPKGDDVAADSAWLTRFFGLATPPAPVDPWPECAIVRKWLKENATTGTTFTVVEWQGIKRNALGLGTGDDLTNVGMRLHYHSDHGDWYRSGSLSIRVRDGEVVEQWLHDDKPKPP